MMRKGGRPGALNSMIMMSGYCRRSVRWTTERPASLLEMYVETQAGFGLGASARTRMNCFQEF
jgi:hypothetical protein